MTRFEPTPTQRTPQSVYAVGSARSLAAWALSALLLAGCSSGPRLEPVNEEAAPPLPTPSPAPREEPTPEPADEATAGEPGTSFTLESEPLGDDGQTVVIHDAADEDPGPRSLAQIAAEERRRRANAGPPLAVIDDKSLGDYSNVQITLTDRPEAADGEPEEPAASEIDLEAVAEAEAHWRSVVREARSRWRDAYDSIETLEGRIAELRRRFYAEDDPYYRDSQIKPAWDHSIERLREAREEVASAREELERLLEQGRREGAFPGWLREGLELEPARDAAERPEDRSVEDAGVYEPEEPPTQGRPGGGGRR